MRLLQILLNRAIVQVSLANLEIILKSASVLLAYLGFFSVFQISPSGTDIVNLGHRFCGNSLFTIIQECCLRVNTMSVSDS